MPTGGFPDPCGCWPRPSTTKDWFSLAGGECRSSRRNTTTTGMRPTEKGRVPPWFINPPFFIHLLAPPFQPFLRLPKLWSAVAPGLGRCPAVVAGTSLIGAGGPSAMAAAGQGPPAVRGGQARRKCQGKGPVAGPADPSRFTPSASGRCDSLASGFVELDRVLAVAWCRVPLVLVGGDRASQSHPALAGAQVEWRSRARAVM